jgi:osmotically-inducible protein OsmY
MVMEIRSDEAIKRDIVDELFWDERVNAADINVEVKNGGVTLSGSVPTYTSRDAAYNAAWSISGVMSVQNLITVSFPAAFEAPDDSEIQARANDALVWNADIHSEDIEISVRNGVVTLNGIVDAYWKKWKAESLVSEVRGVMDIQNELAIVPTKSLQDKEIAKNIEGALMRDLYVDSVKVVIRVEGGVVTLTGRVFSWDARRRAEEIARYTAGVVEVDNKLSIIP